jgi:hypothetical protein
MEFGHEYLLSYGAKRDGQPSDSNRREAQFRRMEGAVHDELCVFEDDRDIKVEK